MTQLLASVKSLDEARIALEYGANEPGAPAVFLTDTELLSVWQVPERHYQQSLSQRYFQPAICQLAYAIS